MNVEKNKIKLFAEKSLSVFEGLKGGPFVDTKTFFLQNVFNFFSPFIKYEFYTDSQTFFHKNMQVIK